MALIEIGKQRVFYNAMRQRGGWVRACLGATRAVLDQVAAGQFVGADQWMYERVGMGHQFAR